jgi:hypothetical protein
MEDMDIVNSPGNFFVFLAYGKVSQCLFDVATLECGEFDLLARCIYNGAA